MTVIINGDTGITSPADSLSGNLTFTGTGNRITGDFSNATLANRVMFQTSTANGNTIVGALTNGTATTSTFNAYNSSDAANNAYIQLAALSTEARLGSTITGTGSYLPMTFHTGGSESLRLSKDYKTVILSGGSTSANGTGITFPATQSASTDANTLDDYEEGTFTPTYITTGTAFDSVSYSLTGGRYVKIGRMVYFQLQMRTASITKGSASGFVRVSGLPFTCASNTGGTEDAYANLSFGEVSGFVTNNPSCGYVYPGTTQHSLFYRTTANGTSYNIIAVADMGTGGSANVAYISGSYVASA